MRHGCPGSSIRSQRFTDHAPESADFVDFLGRAGLGQAEGASLRFSDINWARRRLTVRRHKTGALFFVPIYARLEPLLERRRREMRGRSENQLLFTIKDAKRS